MYSVSETSNIVDILLDDRLYKRTAIAVLLMYIKFLNSVWVER